MTGDFKSVIGMTKDEPLNRFLRKVPGGKFEPATGPGHAVRDRGRDRRRERPCGARRRRAARRHPGRGAAEILGLTVFTAHRVDRESTRSDSVSHVIRRLVLGTGNATRHGGNDSQRQSQSRAGEPRLRAWRRARDRCAGRTRRPIHPGRLARARSQRHDDSAALCCRTAAVIRAATASAATAAPSAISRRRLSDPGRGAIRHHRHARRARTHRRRRRTSSPICASASRT